MTLHLEDVAHSIGREVYDEYGRIIGVLTSFSSNVEGEIEYIEVKIADLTLKRIDGGRVKVRDGKLVAVPEWKHKATRIIAALDRAYRRRKALEGISAGDIPAEVVESLKRKLDEQIKRLKIQADESKREIRERINAISDESLHVESAIALLQMTYFSGEVREEQYTQGMNNLRKLKRALTAEKEDAKKVLDKLEKTIEAASSVKHQPHAEHPVPAQHTPAKPATGHVGAPKKDDTLLVKVVEE